MSLYLMIEIISQVFSLNHLLEGDPILYRAVALVLHRAKDLALHRAVVLALYLAMDLVYSEAMG